MLPITIRIMGDSVCKTGTYQSQNHHDLVCDCFVGLDRRMQSMGLVSWLGMGAVGAWGISTALLVAVAASKGTLYRLYILPDMDLLGPGRLHIFTNICACFCLLTTANSCQLQAPFIVRPVLVIGPVSRAHLLKTITCSETGQGVTRVVVSEMACLVQHGYKCADSNLIICHAS
jgi:hypothetical protein